MAGAAGCAKLLMETSLDDLASQQNVCILKDTATVEQALRVRAWRGCCRCRLRPPTLLPTSRLLLRPRADAGSATHPVGAGGGHIRRDAHHGAFGTPQRTHAAPAASAPACVQTRVPLSRRPPPHPPLLTRRARAAA